MCVLQAQAERLLIEGQSAIECKMIHLCTCSMSDVINCEGYDSHADCVSSAQHMM